MYTGGKENKGNREDEKAWQREHCATPDSIGYLGKRDLVGLRGNWWDW